MTFDEVIGSMQNALVHVKRCHARGIALRSCANAGAEIYGGSAKTVQIFPISQEEAMAIVDRQIGEANEELATHCREFLNLHFVAKDAKVLPCP